MLREARRRHKDIIEHNFSTMNSKELWDTMKAITNMTPAKKTLCTSDDLQKANELNDFFMRFETQDFSSECTDILETISATDQDERVVIDHFLNTPVLRRPQGQMASLHSFSRHLQKN